MKVLLINHFPLEGSGSGTYTKNIALHLRKRGHEVAVIFPENQPFPIVACAKLLLLPFFLLLLYLLSKSKNRFNFKTPIGYAGVTLISSAILSTVLDSLIYKGTPDYFYLIPLYSSVDLKDVFAFLGAGCILSIISTNEKNMQKKTTNMEAK